MKIRDFILSLVSWFILLVTVSCSDELGGERTPISSESNLHVLVPTVLSSRGTRADDASGLPTYNATVDECQINDLTLYAFPVPTGNGNDGKLLVETLPAPLASMMLKENVASYQLNIQPGTYHIYVVANMSDVLKDPDIDSEEKLKNIVLHYGGGTKPGMPVCTNIPMIYEPEKDATTGKLVETKITPTGNKYTEVIANMKFTCVKVKLNLIFDPTQADVNANFGGKSIYIDNIVANKLSPFTNLYWGGKFVKESLADGEYKSGISSNLYDSKASDAPAVYYTDWEDHTLEAETNNKNDIVGKGDATSNLVNPAGKWLFQSTYYLPERYISSAADRSYLTIKGKVANSIDNDYRIDLGHKKDETSNSEVPTFPRGTYYEITGKIKSLGNMTLDCNVSIKPWESVKIDADFNHTTLWVSKTKANVTSLTNDYITYNSNAVTVGFGCDTKINSKDIIIGTKRGKDANGNDSIEFRVNPNIPISAYSEQSGTAKFWLKANNLKKYIDVHYDVTPYLDVTKELVIYYNKDENFKDQNTRTIKWDTNLGGIKLDRTTDKKGSSIIKMSVNSSDDATGTFTVTATEDPVTTTIHEFTVTSKDGSTPQTVRVTVSPPIGDYRICFRAINDRSIYDSNKNDDSRKEVDFMAIKEEGGTNNWYDGWDNNGGADSPKENNHCIYVYTQIGETKIENGNLPNKGKWIYTTGDKDKDNWPGETMTADKTNTGWYYKDFKVDMVQIRKKDTQEDRKIKPGETLIMFNNNKDTGVGYTLHRCPHHREPGIPLFDYEDREGWIVYDPTSDPEYHIFDDMPEIVNLNITIYTEKKTMGWYRKYGVAGYSTTDQFKIKDEITDANVDHGNSWKREKKGNWWKTVITLKAIKGEHNKDIKIKQQDGDELTLFNGNSFKDDTGYYKNGKWYQGKPDDVTE